MHYRKNIHKNRKYFCTNSINSSTHKLNEEYRNSKPNGIFSFMDRIKEKVGFEEIILILLIFFLLDEKVKDDFLIIILLYIFFADQK